MCEGDNVIQIPNVRDSEVVDPRFDDAWLFVRYGQQRARVADDRGMRSPNSRCNVKVKLQCFREMEELFLVFDSL